MSSSPKNVFSGFLSGRSKTFSECSDNSGNNTTNAVTHAESTGVLGLHHAAEHHLYDVDGVFAYTYYEKDPMLYDLDGKHKYKYYNHMKRAIPLPDFSNKARQRCYSESSALGLSDPKSEGSFDRTGYEIDGKFAYRVFDPKTDTARFAQQKTAK